MAYTAPTFETTAVINSTTLFKDYDDQVQILIEDVGQYLEDESNAIYQDLGTIVTDGIINDTSAGSLTTYSSNKINTIADTKQPTLVSGTNIKTVNSTTLLGSGDVAVQPTLVSGTNIKTVNGSSLLGSGDVPVYTGFKNRIINGDMMIDQRNAGASVTANDGMFPVDRFKFNVAVNGKGTGQQSTTAPAGFINSLLFTSNSAYTVGTSENFNIDHYVEGLNVADLGWGTANAATVTLSFWVRSSLTGTFGGSVNNSASNRSYPFSYTISAANTWEQKSITIAGDTSGTWLTTNGSGIKLHFSLGTGTTLSGTAGSWYSSLYVSATGATSVVGTNGATFYITGVQLEKGSVATPFEQRPYGLELSLCQRYYVQQRYDGEGNSPLSFTIGLSLPNSAYKWVKIALPVVMRTSPTVTFESGAGAGWDNKVRHLSTTYGTTGSDYTPYGVKINTSQILFQSYNESGTTSYGFNAGYKASAEL